MSNWKFWIALVVVGLVICLAAIVMVWKILQKQYEKSMLDYQNRMLSQEMEEVKTIYKTMRGWRHDYHNHMPVSYTHLDVYKRQGQCDAFHRQMRHHQHFRSLCQPVRRQKLLRGHTERFLKQSI